MERITLSRTHTTDESVGWLLELIRAVPVDASRPRVVGIDGGGGAGKSTLAGRLAQAAPDAACVHIDDFYRPEPDDPNLRREPCWFFDWRRVRDEVLVPVTRGERASFRPYDWDEGALSETEMCVEADGIVILEGISALRRELREWMDFGIWVETPADLRLQRGLERDGEGARSQWVDYWMPEEERYFELHGPKEYADVVVTGEGRSMKR